MQKVSCFVAIVILSVTVYTQSNSAGKAIDLNNLGVDKMLGGRQDAALGDFRSAVELWPGCLKCRYNLARTLTKTGEAAEAIKIFEGLLIEKPDFGDAYSGLGDALTESGRPEDSLAAYNAALKLNPNDAVTLTNLGNSLEQLKKHDEALTALDKAVKLDPNLAGAHSNRGTTLYSLKRVKEAAESFRRSIELDPNSPETLNNLGVALDALGKKGTQKYFEQALRLKPDWGFPVYNLALVNLKRGERDAARVGLASLERLDMGLADTLRKHLWSKYVVEVPLRTSRG